MEHKHSRRSFLKTSLTTGLSCSLGASLLSLSACSEEEPIVRPQLNLVPDPKGICDLPVGFSYRILSSYDDIMSDGHTVPDYHDGMVCFAGPEGQIILVRNHEVSQYFPTDPESPEPTLAYDPKASGGTTTLWLNDKLEVTKQYLSLTGTIRNCGGGKTPWDTWISSEEVSDDMWRNGTWIMGDRHGYNFEVDPLQPLRKAMPLKAMGRFRHEALAIDPKSGVVYQTEDDTNGCFYRFLPKQAGKLAQGGKLQALKFVDDNIIHTSLNKLKLTHAYPTEWVDIDDVDPPQNTIARQAQAKGAAVFVRGEGIVADDEGIYFTCTNGGTAGLGQFFKYVPDSENQNGHIHLVYEAKVEDVMSNPDNITLNTWGDLIICEDNKMAEKCLIGLRPDGHLYYIASNTISEWAGACFSPDGKTLFANIFRPGKTLAIQGPWETLRT